MDMQNVIYAVAVLFIMGIVSAILLGVAAKVFAVEVDVLLRLRRSQRYSALRLLPATVRLHTFTATAAATQRIRQTTRVCRTATLQCV